MRIPNLPILQKLAVMLSQEGARFVAPLKDTHLDPKDIVDVVDPSPDGAKSMDPKTSIRDKDQKDKNKKGEKSEEDTLPSEGAHLDIKI